MSAKYGLAKRGVILLELDMFLFFLFLSFFLPLLCLRGINPLRWKLTVSFLLSRVNISCPAGLRMHYFYFGGWDVLTFLVRRADDGRRFHSGKGTPRRKVKKIHKNAGTDDKKLQTSLKKLNVQPIQAIEEVNMFKEDGNVIHFAAPKGLCRKCYPGFRNA